MLYEHELVVGVIVVEGADGSRVRLVSRGGVLTPVPEGRDPSELSGTRVRVEVSAEHLCPTVLD